MTAKSLGKIAVASGGGRTAVSSSPLMACRVHFQAVTGETGKIGIGESTVNLATYAGLIHLLWPTGAGGGQPQVFEIVDESSGGNSIDLSKLYVAAQIAGEGCIVSYFQR